MIGQVYKVHTDSYYVKCNNEVIKCRARGVLKHFGNGILVGDIVRVEGSSIVAIEERKNRFIRPNVSNIDMILAVVSPEPKPDYFVIDKLYLNSVKENVEFIIVANKTDINTEVYEHLKEEYGSLGIEIYDISTKSKKGVKALLEKVKGKLNVLAGQSAVGKTSLINAVLGLDLKVGDLSEKILRGKHTTTHSEIFESGEFRIIDTPGFAVIDADVNIEDLPSCYPEYVELSSNCKFRRCNHINEPECAIKKGVESGELSKERYERYVQIFNTLKERRISYEKN